MRPKARRYCLYALGALYLATWIWGIPAVHTRIAADTIRDYKSARDQGRKDVRDSHPRLRFGASYALLPFVTVNHYDYQIAGLYGWSGFTLDVWYLTGSKTFFGLTTRVS